MPKVTYKCTDCGMESNLKHPSQFNKGITKENYRCPKCANKTAVRNPNWKPTTYKCVDCGKERTATPAHFKGMKRETYRCIGCFNKYRVADPEWLERNKIGAKKRKEDPVWQQKMKIKNKNMIESESWKENVKVGAKKRIEDITWWDNQLIAANGEGIWYGNKALINSNYDSRNHYCELWNKHLWVRIDAAYDYKSILSGKTKFENGGRALTRHHLYWQEKACCIWDEDVNGYYAWINNNGENVKYYIDGDPNKFVLLTDKEHGIVRGKKGTTKDRIYYIKFIEEKIKQREKQGKKCYLSPEEYEVYKIEHADIIEKYTKKM